MRNRSARSNTRRNRRRSRGRGHTFNNLSRRVKTPTERLEVPELRIEDLSAKDIKLYERLRLMEPMARDKLIPVFEKLAAKDGGRKLAILRLAAVASQEAIGA